MRNKEQTYIMHACMFDMTMYASQNNTYINNGDDAAKTSCWSNRDRNSWAHTALTTCERVVEGLGILHTLEMGEPIAILK